MKPFRLDRDGQTFDIGSHGRIGPSGRLSLAQIEQIRRTVMRAPEVMVKVSGGSGSRTSRGVSAHFNYISRQGELEIETDDGERLIGKEAIRQLTNDWDLDLDADRQRSMP